MYAQHRRMVERLYEDRATIIRHVEEQKPWGETTLVPVVVAENVPCRLSQRAIGVSNQTESVNRIEYETKLFVAPEVDVRAGDVIAVTKAGVTREYVAGEPFVYATHQEVILTRKEKA